MLTFKENTSPEKFYNHYIETFYHSPTRFRDFKLIESRFSLAQKDSLFLQEVKLFEQGKEKTTTKGKTNFK